MWVSYHLDLPVDVPLFHVTKAPRLDGISGAGVHPDQTIISDTDQLLPLSTLEPAKKKRLGIYCGMKVCRYND